MKCFGATTWRGYKFHPHDPIEWFEPHRKSSPKNVIHLKIRLHFSIHTMRIKPLMFFLWKIFALKKINLKTFSRPWSSLHTSKEIVFFTAFNVQTHLLIKCLKAHERARTFPLLALWIPLCTRLVLAITVIYLLFIFSSLR